MPFPFLAHQSSLFLFWHTNQVLQHLKLVMGTTMIMVTMKVMVMKVRRERGGGRERWRGGGGKKRGRKGDPKEHRKYSFPQKKKAVWAEFIYKYEFPPLLEIRMFRDGNDRIEI